MDSFNDTHQRLENQWWVSGKVTTLGGDPIRGAAVEAEPLNAGGEFRSFSTNLQGMFQTDYWLRIDLFKEFGVTLTVTKKGFLKAQ
jgi:protocatechuate 3,4-dioxygenase beta subunit